MKIIIVTPSLEPNDAVSNDVLEQREHLIFANYQVEIFSEFCHTTIQPLLAKKEDVALWILETDNILLYHHSVYWKIGEILFQMSRCKILLKYHNITPYFFYKKYQPFIFNVTEQGREQTERLVKSNKVKWYIGDSQYNLNELIVFGANKKQCKVIPPFILLQNFEKATPVKKTQQELKKDEFINLLFVGRIVPNKGYLHLIRVLKSYIYFYGTKVCLHLVGGVNLELKKYYKLLEDEIHKYKLGQFIKFHQQIDINALHSFYQSADVFLVLSEHEGFCVPILEAQYHHLPIIAWDQCAVGETLGKGGLLFQDCDYDAFAVAIHRLTSDTNLKHHLIQNGIKNLKQYHKSIILKKILTTLDI